MSVPGSVAEWQKFSRRLAKPTYRFRDHESAPLMAGDGWETEWLDMDAASWRRRTKASAIVTFIRPACHQNRWSTAGTIIQSKALVSLAIDFAFLVTGVDPSHIRSIRVCSTVA